jgi:hypothetical protein
MSGRRARVVSAASLFAPALLAACPQLLNDPFYLDTPVLGASGGSEGEPDASAPATNAGGGAGGGGGAGAGASVPADAGGVADAGALEPPDPIQVALRAALAHRYRFDPDAPLRDSVGGADATSVGATFRDGAAVLAGTTPGQYIDLPNGLLAGLRDASFEIWVTWDVTNPSATTAEWQRIFDFGRNPSTVEGQQCAVDVDATALFLTPSNQSSKLELQCESCTGTTLLGPSSMPTGVPVQLVAVVDDDANLLWLYQNGAAVTSGSFAGSLSQITTCTGRAAPCDWNNWLGRSQHVEDPPFAGKILDFRVYSAALQADWIRASYAAGPDADW